MPRTVAYRAGGFTNYGISYTKFSQEELAEMKDSAMTENEAKQNIIAYATMEAENLPIGMGKAFDTAIKALEDVQRYHAIGTPEELQTMKEHGGFTGVELANIAAMQMKLKEYEAIGTEEECRAAVDKRTVMKPIRMDKCTCPSCGTHNEVWKKRRNTLPSDIVYCWHCGQAVEIFRGDEQ